MLVLKNPFYYTIYSSDSLTWRLANSQDEINQKLTRFAHNFLDFVSNKACKYKMITKINQPLKQKPQFYLTMYNCQDRGLNVERCT